jgi:threonine dehydrogenase-like Zn-dependent dehydrogenase
VKVERFVSRGNVLSDVNGDFKIHEFPLATPGPNDVIVRQELAGMCGTDHHVFKGHWPNHPFPVLLGHENVGVLHALGSDVTTDFTGRPVKVGDRVVTIATGGSCGQCYNCVVLNLPGMCTNPAPAPSRLSTSEGLAVHIFGGGYAELVRLQAPRYVMFKTDLDPATAVMLEPLSNSIHGFDRTPIRLGDTVVIQGSGGIGLPAVAVAKLSGALRIIVVGGPKGRLDLARECGADVCIDIADVPSTDERIRMVRDETPRGMGADIVVGATGIAQTVTEGIAYLRYGGQMCEIGNATDSGTIPFSPYRDLVSKKAILAGISGTGVKHYAEALKVLEKGGFPYQKMVSHQLPLERVAEGIAALGGSYQIDGRDTIKIAIAPNGAPS